MTHDTTQTSGNIPWQNFDALEQEPVLHLAIAWSLDEPERIGEVARIDAPCVLGRGEPQDPDPARRIEFYRQRPALGTPNGPLHGPRVSRLQLIMRPAEEGVDVQSVGRCPLLVNGTQVERAVVQEGDTLTLKDSLVLLVVRRPPSLEAVRNYPANLAFAFGMPDSHGLVGESPLIWELRDNLAFAARSPHHVLLYGETGVGKEIAAHALHTLSPRAGRSLVTRNAATLPENLIDLELFGSARNYPNAGTPERSGLIAEADGGTLLLDEVGELPDRVQAHLLRVLDREGEYQRLGDSSLLRADVRMLAATNRPLGQLKHDFSSRFTLRIHVAGLDERREDIPLLMRELLSRAATTDKTLAERFFAKRDGGAAEPRLDPMLVDALLRHRYTQHLREVERLLWIALGTSQGNFIALTPELREELVLTTTSASSPEIGPPEIEAALRASEGNVTAATRELGLRNRFVLYRLMKRHGIVWRT